MRGKILATGLVLLASIGSPLARSATIEVPSQQPTIRAALAAAAAGDVVRLAPGTYYETNLAVPDGITLVGAGSTSSATVLDGQGKGRILSLEFLETGSTIRNLTFTRGFATGETSYDKSGGAIFVICSQFVIDNCRFLNNSAETFGGAIRCMGTPGAENQINKCYFESNEAQGGGALDCSYDASPWIIDSIFSNNSADWGGALACRGNSAPKAIHCRFDTNTAAGNVAKGGAVLSFFWGEPEFSTCTFSRNSAGIGGALYADTGSPASLTSCTVASNYAQEYGAGLFTNDAAVEIKSSIIAFQNGIGLISQGTQLPLITCTDIYGNSGGDWIGNISPQADQAGNLSVDPLFCTGNLDEEYTFNLQDGSPCSAAQGACDDMGAWPVGCDTEEETLSDLSFITVVWENGAPVIIWEVTGSRAPVGFRLARSSSEFPQNETEIPYTTGENGEFVAHDTGFEPLDGVHYFYRLYLVMDNGSEFLLGAVELAAPPPAPVLTLANVGAWPNPFNPQTSIHFELASSQRVRVEIYGIDGRRVRTLADRNFETGPQNLTWNGADDAGRVMASGPYIVVVNGQKDAQRLKVTLLK